MFRLFSVIIGYIFGCFQSADFVQKRLKLPGNIRELGTHNPGTSNMADQFGAKAGIATLFLDMSKTMLAAYLCWILFGLQMRHVVTMYAGLGAVVGHCYPAHKRFKGGRGIACIHGIALMLGWKNLSMVFLGEIAGILLSRLMIGGAFGAMLAFPVTLFLLDFPFEARLVGVMIYILLLLRHIDKLKRIFRGEETRFSFSRFADIFRKRSSGNFLAYK